MTTKIIFISLSLISALSAVPRNAFAAEEAQQESFLRLPMVDDKADPEDYFSDCVRENNGSEGRCEAATITFYKLESNEAAQPNDSGESLQSESQVE